MPDLQRVGGVSEFIAAGHMAEKSTTCRYRPSVSETSVHVARALRETPSILNTAGFSTDIRKLDFRRNAIARTTRLGFTFNYYTPASEPIMLGISFLPAPMTLASLSSPQLAVSGYEPVHSRIIKLTPT